VITGCVFFSASLLTGWFLSGSLFITVVKYSHQFAVSNVAVVHLIQTCVLRVSSAAGGLVCLEAAQVNAHGATTRVEEGHNLVARLESGKLAAHAAPVQLVQCDWCVGESAHAIWDG
jgi:hypothetical protein